jgi:D-glycero-alpha-D-manno-heptose-7-phosphate kinase
VIISRAPVRISLGGGGTDLKSYYSKYGGFLIAGAIDKYIFISANKRFYDSIRLSYSQTEIANSVDEIKHKIFREGLKFLNMNNGIELVSIADVPANCGLGSSSSFTVSLLNSLHAYKREFISQKQLAEEACHIEIDVLGEPIGKQDQYISAFGGVTTLTIERDGDVIVEPVKMNEEAVDELERNILLFHTGIERSASEILSEQNDKSMRDDAGVIETLHQIKKIGLKTKKEFERGDLDRFGDLLDVHWQVKKHLSKMRFQGKMARWEVR